MTKADPSPIPPPAGEVEGRSRRVLPHTVPDYYVVFGRSYFVGAKFKF